MIALRILLYGTAGALTAVIYISALSWNVRLYIGQGPKWGAALVHLVRLLVVGAGFTLCARQGALALLSSLAGFQVIRTIAINRQSLAMEKSA
jgi:F1F0 ATPase subunit 2